jgi:hemerythrin
MNDLKWKDEYQLGIPAVDLQHQRIFDCLVTIAGGSTEHDRLLAEFATVRLLTLIQQHSALEESMMRSFGYPGLERHSEEHRQFHSDVHDWAQTALRTKERVSYAVIKAFHVRQREHLMTSDRQYLEYFLGPPRKRRDNETGSEPVGDRAGARIHGSSLLPEASAATLIPC